MTQQVSAGGEHTIPPQGYPDIAASTFLERRRTWGAPANVIAGWQARNGSNALALYRALLSGYAKVRPGQHPQRLALLCRRHDAQLTEQKYLLERFREWGADADIVYPDQLSGQDTVTAQGKSYDLIYRHLFVRRLEEALAGADYVKGLLAEASSQRAVVLNPPASQVEVKAVSPWSPRHSRTASWLNKRSLSTPSWKPSKSLCHGPALPREALLAEVASDPNRYVLKRSWDYGAGRSSSAHPAEPSSPSGSKQLTARPWPGTSCAYGLRPTRWAAACGGKRWSTSSPEMHVRAPASPDSDRLYVDFPLTRRSGWRPSQNGEVCAEVRFHTS